MTRNLAIWQQKIRVENTIDIYQMKANFMAEIMAQFH